MIESPLSFQYARSMHSSYFSYSITRPYPYKWFTPVAVAGGITLAVLLSVFNFVQNSYTLIVQYTDNPNATIANGIWFNHWPSYLTSSVRPTCEPADFPLNTQFFTNQSGLTWTLTSVFDDESSSTISPSLTYMNNVFENCTVPQIQMAFDGTQDRDVAVSSSAAWDIQVRAFVTCGVWTPLGYNRLNLTAVYDAVQPYTVAGSSVFVATNPQSRASMFWAEALLSAFWVDTACVLDNAALHLHPTIVNGYANVFPVEVDAAITDLAFFNVTFDFLWSTEDSGFGDSGPLHSIKTYIDDSKIDFDPQPQIWTQVDNLGKSMYSAVLADLGQTPPTGAWSLLTNATTLQSFSSRFPAINHVNILDYKQIELLDYNSRQQSANPTGPLGITPSVISTKYLCQVPQRKSIGDILISVLLADLVLLQAAWKIYSYAVKQAAVRKQSTGNYCEGCVEDQLRMEEGSDIRRAASRKTKGESTVYARDLAGLGEHTNRTTARWRTWWNFWRR